MTATAKSTFAGLVRLVGRTPLGRSRLLMAAQERIVGILFRETTVRAGGFTLRVHPPGDWLSRKLLVFGAYEPDVLEVMIGLVKPGDTVVDVGAHIGYHTLHLSRAVGDRGRVLAFEPDPENLALLRENLRLNESRNVTVFPFALGDADGKRPFFVDRHHKGSQGFANVIGSGRQIMVEVRSAADVLGPYRPSFMKIDVEGAEPLVLHAMTDKPEQIVFEFVPRQLRAMGFDPTEFLEWMVGEGYRLQRIAGRDSKPVAPDEMTRLADSTGLDHNLLATRDPALRLPPEAQAKR